MIRGFRKVNSKEMAYAFCAVNSAEIVIRQFMEQGKASYESIEEWFRDLVELKDMQIGGESLDNREAQLLEMRELYVSEKRFVKAESWQSL